MSMQLLTGREVLRTHIFWRIMLKRVIWGLLEAARARRQVADEGIALDADANLPVTDVLMPESGAQLRSTSFYEDYLHRGSQEPLNSMSLYVYAMHVQCVHVKDGCNSQHGEYSFSAHYAKAATHVQILQGPPRIPYIHGITMPTKVKDPSTRAAVHLALFKPHCCRSEEFCGRPCAVAYFRLANVLTEWRAVEAEMETLAGRADVAEL